MEVLLAGDDHELAARVARFDDVLADPPRAALELRKLLAYPNLETILVGDGDSIFGNGRERLLECLVARDDIWLG